MKESTRTQGSTVVVGVDGSPQSILALKWANTLAPTLGATIVAVTTWQIDPMYSTYAVFDQDPADTARSISAEALVKAFGGKPPEDLTALIVRGQPAKVLIELSLSAKLLVVGSRGRGGFTGLLMGSVSSACAAHATCPVLVLHADERTDSDNDLGAVLADGPDEPAGQV
ncbi:universal stress protein [Arthrobacter sp. E3]|uniref:universal stress protein n=1 Tax=Arthrobacter sp. E3 TaxID=517402 RepID=UPI001A93ABD0|nr:universal stress protein [Arthrobacter sp. E3]